MQLLPGDPGDGRGSRLTPGLERLAPLIARLRAASPNTLLVDNGDLLQGNDLADHIAGARPGAARVHPAIASLNALGCDAATLGNHDFAFGTRFLAQVIAGAAYPVVSANLSPTPGLGAVAPWVVLQREVTDGAGRPHRLRIGVIGFLPPQTAQWERVAAPQLRTRDVIEAAEEELPRLRAAGAEVVVALVHGGPGAGPPHVRGAENAAGAVAALPGVDAVVAGHVHTLYPPAGSVADYPRPGPAPLVMPGFGGSHLGVIQLQLRHGSDGWVVTGATSQCLAPEASDASVACDAARAIRRAAGPSHRAATRATEVTVGRTTVPLNSHFAMLGLDAGLHLVASAKRWRVRQALAATRWAGLPIIAAVAPFRAGGLGGSENYVDLPPGRLRRGDLSRLYAFTNRLVALPVTGLMLGDWLERAAGAFRRIAPGIADQPILDDAFPSYSFDLLDGLTWQLDLSQPARHDAEGRLVAPGASRVCDIRHRGLPVAPDQPFILATTDYRTSGVGLYGAPISAPVHADARPMREVLAAYLRRSRTVAPRAWSPLRFLPVPGASVIFTTSPAARPLPGTEALGPDPQGALRLRIDLDGGFDPNGGSDDRP